jgi:hydrogenase maturation protein HypF
MCTECFTEYNHVEAPRFYSQTNSCDDCGIKLSLYQNSTSVITRKIETVLSQIKKYLSLGKIVAVKGIGGYLLLCDANNEAVIQLLLTRKHRPSKPLAVLYPNLQPVLRDFKTSDNEKKLLLSPEAPIVLLYPRPDAGYVLKIKSIAPGLRQIGVMLPYNPLLELIAGDFGKPVVATSANISGSPIIYKDEVALDQLFEIADYVVTHDRGIVVPQDDSVVQLSRYTQTSIMLRRSRGYAPSYIHYKPYSRNVILATGAFLKSSFALSVNGNLFLSQFLGSGETYDSQEVFKATLDHWLQLYDTIPDVILADQHPGYFSHQYAIELSEKYAARLNFVQHHEAHLVAALAENNLIHSQEEILGVIWDGTGLGSDGNIWGGEFFTYSRKTISRYSHFDYFPVIAGDKFALEPRLALLCTTEHVWPRYESIAKKFTSTELKNYQSLIRKASLFSSSVGRIFDSVASLLGICDKQSFEGEAAMLLQSLAHDWISRNNFEMDGCYVTEEDSRDNIPTALLMYGVIRDIQNGKSKNYIAAKFHYSLVCLIGMVAKNANVRNICFSGGVFQNALLVDWIRIKYKNEYQLFFHNHLSPNDENISFGQLAYYDNEIKSSEFLVSRESGVVSRESGVMSRES